MRTISAIARDIRKDWKKPNYAAIPYLGAMATLDYPHENYGYDDASTIIRYFLSNASTWRGPKAKEIKAELKAMIGAK